MAQTPPCARCGRDAQFDFDELWLCLDCYHVAGSTCAGVTRGAAAPAPARSTQPDGTPHPDGAGAPTAASAEAVC